MKLSIIVPVYNVEKYLEKCLISLISQKLENFEIIIVNDGTKDESEKIIKKFLKYKFIKYYKKENGGLSDARNYGIKYSQGEYLAFVDSDDYIQSDMFIKMLNKAEDEKLDMVICGVSRINLNNEELRSYIPKTNNIIEILENSYACNKIYKKELFIKNNISFPKGKHYEDIFTIPLLALKSSKIGIIKEKLYYYVERPGAITSLNNNIKILDIIRAYIEVEKNINIYLKNNENKKLLLDFNKAKLKMKNSFLIRTISGYSFKFIYNNSSQIINLFKLLNVWSNKDYFKLLFAMFFPKNKLKNIRMYLKNRKTL